MRHEEAPRCRPRDRHQHADIRADTEEPRAVLHGDDRVLVADRHAELAGLAGQRSQPPDFFLAEPDGAMGREVIIGV